MDRNTNFFFLQETERVAAEQQGKREPEIRPLTLWLTRCLVRDGHRDVSSSADVVDGNGNSPSCCPDPPQTVEAVPGETAVVNGAAELRIDINASQRSSGSTTSRSNRSSKSTSEHAEDHDLSERKSQSSQDEQPLLEE